MADYAVTVVFIVKAKDEATAQRMVEYDSDFWMEMVDDNFTNPKDNPYISHSVVETSPV
ncbi:MAG TPA: hypothetical protein P5539_05565 [Mesotoga sp.]|nr:hypothetical protein [Mesotoga sp.]